MPSLPTATVADPDVTAMQRHADVCVAAIGGQLTAYLAGAASVHELQSWRAGPVDRATSARAARRLAAVMEVVRIFASDNIVSMLRPWLIDPGVDGDPAPARMIRVDGDDDSAMKALFQTAANWAANHRSVLARA